MKNFEKKLAFTMAEVLLSMVIVGIISVLSFQTLKVIKNKYHNAYYSAFNILTQSAGNAAMNWQEEAGTKTGVITLKDNWDNYQSLAAVAKTGLNKVKYPGFLLGSFEASEFGDNKRFCERILKWVNVIEDVDTCNDFVTNTSINSTATLTSGESFKNLFGNCTSGKCKMPNPTFKTTNGLNFYITEMTGAVGKDNYKIEQGSDVLKTMVRFVAVDLNGDRSPNEHLKKGSTLPDIVWFAILDNGAVAPLGRPEIDTHYLRANVLYPEYINKDLCNNDTGASGADNRPDYNLVDNTNCNMDETNPPIVKSKPMPYYDAKISAWGEGDTSVTGLKNKEGFSQDEPMSYSAYINFAKDNSESDSFFRNIVKQAYFSEIGSTTDIFNGYATTLQRDDAHGCSTNISNCKVSPMK